MLYVSAVCTHLNAECSFKIKAGMVTIRFESELASFQENLNQVSSVSLLMTASTALANEGRRVSSISPSLARAFEEVMSKETDET